MVSQERPIKILALTSQGAALARRLGRELAGAECWLPKNQAGEPGDQAFSRLSEAFREAFERGDNLVCIMAAGIVVRGIAPYLQGKDTDPAVVVVDEAGRFAISLLSGHLGGANELARRVAKVLGGAPVITTATDVQGLPALDVLAVQHGLTIENLAGVRPIHMALLEGRPVRLVDPEGFLYGELSAFPELFSLDPDLDRALNGPGPTVYAGFRERYWPPGWLRLRPRNLVAGMGCHKGAPAEELVEFIKQTFKQEGLSLLSLKALATIEAKKDEPGLRMAARVLGVEFLWFTATELEDIPVPNPSPRVARHMQVASVSEAAALKAGGVELIVTKQKSPNATLAVARVVWR
ncbi:MAG: cobalt-precorrin 5A hydrolase [Deltaproteobacteria bacterium]|nr:cobalt-precorrin 5A hydrolase [Deltaproteobacteria bacterium]